MGQKLAVFWGKITMHKQLNEKKYKINVSQSRTNKKVTTPSMSIQSNKTSQHN